MNLLSTGPSKYGILYDKDTKMMDLRGVGYLLVAKNP